MTYCACDISALRVLREHERKLGDAVLTRRTSRLKECAAPRCTGDLQDFQTRYGYGGHLYCGDERLHFLVSDASHVHEWSDERAVRHVRENPLPRASLVKVDASLMVSGPELVFLEAAASMVHKKVARRVALIRLALLGYELAGTYVLDAEDAMGFRTTKSPMTSVERLRGFLKAMTGSTGITLARDALTLVQNRSHSPMESAEALLLCGPRRIGGIGFPHGVLNCEVMTVSGPRYIDIAWPELGVGLEYQGRQWHMAERVRADDRRRNTLAGSGFMLFTVWYEDLARPALFDELVKNLSRALGVRIRIRSKEFLSRQRLLRAHVLPPVRRYDDVP